MSLLFRLTIPLALLFLVAFAFVGFAAVAITADTVERGLEERIDATLTTISANPEFFVIEAALREEMAGHLSQVADISGFEIVVATRSDVVASTVGRGAAVELLGREPGADRFPVTLDGVAYRGARGVVLGRRVFLLSPAAPVEAAKAAAQRRVLLAAGVGLAVSVVLGVLLAGTVTRPIRRLARALGEVSEGGARPELPRGGGREVEDLGGAFLDMLARLDRYREEIVGREKMATLGQFSAAVAHELRNPLSSMRMTLDLLRDEVDPAAREELDFLRAEASRLDHSVEELLFYAGEPRYDMRAADMTEVVGEALRMLAPLAAHLEVALARDESVGPLPIEGDASRLRQAVVNLVLNALQASSPGQDVEVVASGSAAEVTVEVRDQGPGIPEEIEEGVFRPFVTGRAGGTGLGLAVTSSIATAHGGTISYERRGGRTTFRLRLPRGKR